MSVRMAFPSLAGLLAGLVAGVFTTQLSCVYGHNIEVSVTTIEPSPHAGRPRPIKAYFGSKKPRRPYRQVAHLQAAGASHHTTTQLLDKLKEAAARLGAHALVDVRVGSKTRVSGEVFSEATGKGSPEQYSATVVRGIAVSFRRSSIRST